MWRLQAEAEGLTLLTAENTVGYFGVCLDKPGQAKPYKEKVKRRGKMVHLGTFATAEEAALCVARSPAGRAAAKRAAAAADAAPPLTSKEARQQAHAEGLTLLKADNQAGYFGVYHCHGRAKPYLATVRRDGNQVSKPVTLGRFATAEEAALCVARSPEGQAAAKKAAAAGQEDVLVLEVEVVEAEEAEEAEDVQVEVVEMVEGGRPKRRRNS